MTERTKILFKMVYLYHKAAYDPLIDLFRRDPQYDVAISLSGEVEKKWGLFEKNISQRYLRQFAQEGYRVSDEKENFDIVIVPDILDKTPYDDTLVCLMFHGVTFTKTVTFRKLRKDPQTNYMIFVEGDVSLQLFRASNTLHRSEVYKVGLPKLDPYFWEGHLDREEILSSLGLDPSRPTVLFAPSYKPTCIYEIKDAIFDATRDKNLLIKLHHYSWMGKFARHSQHRIFERRLSRFPHAVIIPQRLYNIVPFMYAADTLVSEASGSVTEFLATGKTGVIYDLDHNRLRHSDGEFLLTFDNREFLKDSFVHVKSPQELRDGIERALNPTPDMTRAAARDRDRYFYKLDGKASERTKSIIERLYLEGTHLNRSKP